MDIIRGIPRIDKEIEYTKRHGQSMKLDVYTPTDSVNNKRPAIIMVHPGRWAIHDKSAWVVEAARFAKEGFVAIAMDYRMTNGVRALPSQIENVRAAIRFVRANVERFGIDPDRISIFGGSAGGHLAALAAVEPDPLDPAGKFRALAIWSGFFELTTSHSFQPKWGKEPTAVEIAIGGTPQEFPEQYKKFSPTTHIPGNAPPTLVFCSTNETSPLSDSKGFVDKLKAAGVDAELVVLEGAAHSREFSPFSIDITVDFYKKHG